MKRLNRTVNQNDIRLVNILACELFTKSPNHHNKIAKIAQGINVIIEQSEKNNKCEKNVRCTVQVTEKHVLLFNF